MFIYAQPQYVSHRGYRSIVPYRQVVSGSQRNSDMSTNRNNMCDSLRAMSGMRNGSDNSVEDLDYTTEHVDRNSFDSEYDAYPTSYRCTGTSSSSGSMHGGHSFELLKQTPYHNIESNSVKYRVFQTPNREVGYDRFDGLPSGNFEFNSGLLQSGPEGGCSNISKCAGNSFAINPSMVDPLCSHMNEPSLPSVDAFSTQRAMIRNGSSTYPRPEYLIDPTQLTRMDMQDMNSEIDWWQPPPSYSAGFHYGQEHREIASYDGLPTYSSSPQAEVAWYCNPQYCASNGTTSYQSSSDALRFEVPLAMSTSGSSQGSTHGTSTSGSEYSFQDSRSDYTKSTRKEVADRQYEDRYRRKFLEDPKHGRRQIAILPSNDFDSTERHRTDSQRQFGTRSTSSDNGLSYSSSSDVNVNVKRAGYRAIEAKPVKEKPVRHSWDAAPKATVVEEVKQYRSEKDNFLVQSKLAGMSYKEIRRKGNFAEAESTLRGRFRTLTKHKTARVRKPEWDENDNRLLRKAVRKLSKDGDSSKGKIPWKQVAEYISRHGGSYHFGNATCRKQWDELQGCSP